MNKFMFYITSDVYRSQSKYCTDISYHFIDNDYEYHSGTNENINELLTITHNHINKIECFILNDDIKEMGIYI